MKKPMPAIEKCTIELSSSVAITFCRIPACPEGFLMGSRGYRVAEEPMHRVVIAEDFWLAETQVTQAQFDLWPGAVTRGREHHPNDSPLYPANNLSWNDAVEYCCWLTAHFQKQFPKGLSAAMLPCEAQWEYACRGGTETEYHSGDGKAALENVGWYRNNSGYSTHPVGTARGPNAANGFGLYNMHGNVFEWCLDRWAESAYARRWDKITDRETVRLNEEFGDQSDDLYRVVRGGSGWNAASWCRSAYRGRDWAGRRGGDFGFRVCLVRSPSVQIGEFP